MANDKLWNSNYMKLWIGNFLIHFSFTLIVPLLPLYLSETYATDKDMIGLVLAGYAIVGLFVRPFGGYITDKFPRKAVMLICEALFVCVFFGYIFAQSLIVFAIFRTLHGGPFGAVTVSTSTVMIDVLPSSRRTEGIGYWGLSNNLAMTIGPALAVYVLAWAGGNYQALFTLSTVVALASFVLAATVKMPPKDYQPRTLSKGEKEKHLLSLDRFFLMESIPEAVDILFIAASYGIISTYVAIYGKEELGMTSETGIFFTLFAVGLIVSRLTGAHALRKNLVARNATMGLLVSLFAYVLFASMHNHFGYFASAFILGLGNGHMYPAFQNMFINLAENNRRGTANSTLMTAWEAGIGIGILGGGIAAEHFGYSVTFWIALLINVIGIAYWFIRVRGHFEGNKLR